MRYHYFISGHHGQWQGMQFPDMPIPLIHKRYCFPSLVTFLDVARFSWTDGIDSEMDTDKSFIYWDTKTPFLTGWYEVPEPNNYGSTTSDVCIRMRDSSWKFGDEG